MLSLSLPLRPLCAAAGLCLALTAHAQTEPPTLREALDAAWALSPASRAASHRLDELQARERAAQSLLSAPPNASLAHRTDRLNTNGGLREYEAEIALPLWNPGVRAATQRQAGAERAAFTPQQDLTRLKLAGELRELAAQAAQARAEREVAARKRDEASQLAGDVDRRVRAGEVARVDSLQAQGVMRQAEAVLAQTDAAINRVESQWRSLTGLPRVALLDEPPASTNSSDEHPALRAAQAHLRSAQAKLALTDADRRDAMSVGVGLTRERSAAGAAGETTLRVALNIPFGGTNRNAPRLAAARAELETAQAEADAAVRQTDAERVAAGAALEAARRGEAFAAQRASLAAQAQALIAKSHQLGEADLPTRLRADNEKFDADLALARSRIDVQRAIAQQNQAFGLLP